MDFQINSLMSAQDNGKKKANHKQAPAKKWLKNKTPMAHHNENSKYKG